jgi:uncharacterized membrane protein
MQAVALASSSASKISRVALAVFFVVAGACHFLRPEAYATIVPPALPSPIALVYISGAAEIVGGVGILVGSMRPLAAGGLIALLIAVFPANIYAVFHGMQIAHHVIPRWILWARLPLQPLLVAWVYIACWKTPKLSRS